MLITVPLGTQVTGFCKVENQACRKNGFKGVFSLAFARSTVSKRQNQVAKLFFLAWKEIFFSLVDGCVGSFICFGRRPVVKLPSNNRMLFHTQIFFLPIALSWKRFSGTPDFPTYKTQKFFICVFQNPHSFFSETKYRAFAGTEKNWKIARNSNNRDVLVDWINSKKTQKLFEKSWFFNWCSWSLNQQQKTPKTFWNFAIFGLNDKNWTKTFQKTFIFHWCSWNMNQQQEKWQNFLKLCYFQEFSRSILLVL